MVTERLYYDRQYFLQALEGDREALHELYLDIADDPRYDGLAIIDSQEINEPIFSHWKIGYAASQDLGQQEFSPNTMSTD